MMMMMIMMMMMDEDDEDEDEDEDDDIDDAADDDDYSDHDDDGDDNNYRHDAHLVEEVDGVDVALLDHQLQKLSSCVHIPSEEGRSLMLCDPYKEVD